MTSPNALERVEDPVAHISISGVHGRNELEERLAHATAFRWQHQDRRALLGAVVAGAFVGAALMYLFKRD